MNRRNATPAILAVLLLAAGFWAAHRLSFDWHSLRQQLRSVDWKHVAFGIACIYSTFWLRGIRWKILIGSRSNVRSSALVAPQFIGFTAVALFGRLADLGRPYLIARRTHLPVTGQIAIYSIERIFDLASAAIIFSVTLVFAPMNLPHHAAFARAGILSLGATCVMAALVVAIRIAGERLAALARRLLQPLSAKFADSAAARILDFRAGLDIFTSGRDFAITLAVSLLIWLAIAAAYLQSVHSMAATPELATLGFTQTMLLMATSMGGSLLQLPILGWFTQIGIMAAAVHTIFGVPVEAATAYGAVLLLINTLCIIPTGLVAAQISGTSLRSTTAPLDDEAIAPR